MSTVSQPGAPVTDPDVAATARLLHRRHGWGRAAATGFVAFALGYSAYASAQSQGTPPPAWVLGIVIALGAITVAGIAAAVAETVLLRRRPAAVRAQAAGAAALHPARRRARHYPPGHRLSWVVRWTGMLLIVAMAVISAPGLPDGAAYLAGAGPTVTFDPVSPQTTCGQHGCDTSTEGVLETGGAGTEATWPDVVPLGRPFRIREPVWRWGLGLALIDGDGTAVIAIVISLLTETAAAVVLVHLVLLARNWLRHRRYRHQPAGTDPVPAG